jgi:isohexenylglutaconyl-CoA hydratase
VTTFDNLETLHVTIDDMTAHVTLNRPQARNAMNQKMVEELTDVFQQLNGNRDVRAVLLSGAEGTFCSGGDIKEMRESDMPDARSASNLDAMLQAVNQASQVVIARIEGAALGGGLGLVCVTDIAITTTDTQFGLPEVRLGVAPAFISPYVLQRVGLTRTRELMLTGRRFRGEKARVYGLVHEVCPPDELQDCIDLVLDDVRQCAPGAIAATKELIFKVNDTPPDKTVSYRASLLNRLRAGDEAQEGLLAFIEKRPAKWVSGE